MSKRVRSEQDDVDAAYDAIRRNHLRKLCEILDHATHVPKSPRFLQECVTQLQGRESADFVRAALQRGAIPTGDDLKFFVDVAPLPALQSLANASVIEDVKCALEYARSKPGVDHQFRVDSLEHFYILKKRVIEKRRVLLEACEHLSAFPLELLELVAGYL